MSENVTVRVPFYCSHGQNIQVGNHCFINLSYDLEQALPVKIGNNIIIGSGSVVTKDIEDNVIVVENPVHVLRKITEEDHNFWLQQEQDYYNE